WVNKSVIAPPPKLQNHRQRLYFSRLNGWSGAPPSHCVQSSCATSTGFGTQFRPWFFHQYVRSCVTCPSAPPWLRPPALPKRAPLLCPTPHCRICLLARPRFCSLEPSSRVCVTG